MAISLAQPPTGEQPALVPARRGPRPVRTPGPPDSSSGSALADPAGELGGRAGLFRGLAYAIPCCAAFWATAFVVARIVA